MPLKVFRFFGGYFVRLPRTDIVQKGFELKLTRQDVVQHRGPNDVSIENKRRATRQKLTESMAVFDDMSYRLDNWSRGGAKIRDYSGRRNTGDVFPIALEVSTEKGRLRLVGEGTVVWKDEKELGLTWVLSDALEELGPILNVFLGASEASSSNV